LLCWTSISISYNPSFHGIYEIITFKDQSMFIESFLTMKFFIPKFIKIRWYWRIFSTFGSDFSIMLVTFGLIPSVKCIGMSELKLV
jgi:hypothetical protein